MLHFLLNAVDPETNLPAYSERRNLLVEARLLVLAGTDTSAGTLCDFSSTLPITHMYLRNLLRRYALPLLRWQTLYMTQN
jgi:hypothetical protein